MNAVRRAAAEMRRTPLLVAGATASALFFAAPAVYVLWRVVDLGLDLDELWRDVQHPLWRTIQLAVLCALTTGVVGTGLAWLLVRTDVPLRRVWRVLAALPLVFPSFIGAAAFVAGLAPNGVLRNALEAVGWSPPRRFRGLGATWLVVSLFTYPYVYMPVAARLSSLPASLEESARLLGDAPRRLFWRVVLPAVRSPMLGGMLLVFLYSLSEFGAAQLLGYDTLTRVVYATRLVDRAQSFGAAATLLVLAVLVVTLERRLRGETGATSARVARHASPLRLGRWRPVALVAVLIPIVLALVVPVVTLGHWAWRGLSRDGDWSGALASELGDLRAPAQATALLGVGAAALTVLAVLPAAVLATRRRSSLAVVVNAAVLAGFAVPGIVIALSLVFWTLNVPGFERLYQTVPLLLAAYVVHFGSQAMRPAQNAVAAVPRRVAESARLLGAHPLRRALTVHVPMMRPALLVGLGLVLLATLKELPATLLLAPTGLDTLATEVWQAFEEGFLAEAALASLVLVALSAVLTWALVLRRGAALHDDA